MSLPVLSRPQPDSGIVEQINNSGSGEDTAARK